MISRKNMGSASPLLLITLVLGVCFATYNLVIMVMHNRSFSKLTVYNSDGGTFVDPIIEMPESVRKSKRAEMPFHVALTATDAPYSKWQCRIMYYWYKKQKDLPGSEMGGFTRILHSGSPDNLMNEIPTVIVDPLPAGLDRVSFFCVTIILVVTFCMCVYRLGKVLEFCFICLSHRSRQSE